MKKVPETAVAIQQAPATPLPPVGKLVSGSVSGTVVGALAAICLTGALLLPGTAQAQSTRAPKLTGNPIEDINAAVAQKQQQAIANGNHSVEDIVSQIQKLSLPDFQYALAMSIATKNVVSTPCWQAWVDLITAQQSPLLGPSTPQLDPNGKPVLDASGKPVMVPGAALVEPDPHLITAVEQISELLANLRPDSTISTSCAALAAAAGKDAATLISGILNGGALGLFKLPIPIGPIP